MNERRVVPRLSMQIPVELTLSDTGLKFQGHTRDISEEGIFFYAAAPVAERQNVEVLMTFSGDITPLPIRIECRAVVLRVERESIPANTGIAVAIQKLNFLNGDPAARPGIPFQITEFSGAREKK